MRAGRLRTKIQLQSRTETRSATGQPTGTWSTYAEPYAAVWTISGSDYYSQQGTQNQITAEIRIRYRDDVRPEHRVVMRGETYEIAGPPENLGMRNQELLIRLRRVD